MHAAGVFYSHPDVRCDARSWAIFLFVIALQPLNLDSTWINVMRPIYTLRTRICEVRIANSIDTSVRKCTEFYEWGRKKSTDNRNVIPFKWLQRKFDPWNTTTTRNCVDVIILMLHYYYMLFMRINDSIPLDERVVRTVCNWYVLNVYRAVIKGKNA